MLSSYRLSGMVLGFQVLALCLSGCAKEKVEVRGEEGRWVQKAPTSAEETGYLVSGVSKQSLERALAETGAKARALDEKAGAYEIFGAAPERLSAALPGAKLRKNEYFENIALDQILMAATLEQRLGCKPLAAQQVAAPKFSLKALNHVEEFAARKGVIDIKNPYIAFAASGEGLQFYWQVFGPQGLAENNKTFTGPTFGMNANVAGAYGLKIVAQDHNGFCLKQTVMFGVTWNAPYLGSRQVHAAQLAEYQQFPYLAAIGAQAAWLKSKGRGVKVAVLDSGVNYNHPDLSPNISANLIEGLADGRDDDANGFADDYVGWDFVNGDNMPFDDFGHGSHVAGLVAGAVFGVAPNASVLPVKVLNAWGGGDAGSIEQGIYYAVNEGADIIVLSLGQKGNGFKVLQQAFNYAEAQGVLMVVAAGNEESNTDQVPFYPANFNNKNVLTVASTELDGRLASYSNFGRSTVAIAAPGGSKNQDAEGLLGPDYLSVNSSNYVRKSGTSMAAPVAAGVAALVMSVYPELHATQVKSLLMQTGRVKLGLIDKVSSGSMVNAAAAVTQAERLAYAAALGKQVLAIRAK